MSFRLHLSLIIGCLLVLIFIVSLIKRRKLEVKYSIIWIISAIILLLFAVIPDIVEFLTYLLGVQTDSNTVYLLIIVFLLLVSISATISISFMTKRIITLSQEIGILKSEMSRMQNDILNFSDKNKPDITESEQRINSCK